MSEGEKSKNHVLWKNERIGKPPQRRELILDYAKITRAFLSFDIDLQESHSGLDNETGILVNDTMVPNMNLPLKQNSKSLEAVERKNLNITSLLRTSESGEKNTIEVNYRLGPVARHIAIAPGFKAGVLNLEIKVYYPTDITTHKENQKHCMWCGRSIPRDAAVCPYDGRAPPLGGLNPKKCINCDTLLPHEAVYCEECGHKQAAAESSKLCINCSATLLENASFCSSCGTKQPDSIKTVNGDKNFCVSCRNPLQAGSRFCPSCGFQQP